MKEYGAGYDDGRSQNTQWEAHRDERGGTLVLRRFSGSTDQQRPAMQRPWGDLGARALKFSAHVVK